MNFQFSRSLIDSDINYGHERGKERPVSMHVPWQRHVDDNIVALKNGVLATFVRLSGLPYQTMDNAELNARLHGRNNILKSLNTSKYGVYVTIIRRRIEPEIDGKFDNPFVEELDNRYMGRLGEKVLFVNDMYVTILRRRLMTGKLGLVDRLFNAFSSAEYGQEEEDAVLAELRDKTTAIVKDFSSYGAVALGVVERRGSLFSEPCEFLSKILTGGDNIEIPLPRMALNEAVPTRQIFFGRNALEIKGMNLSDTKLGAMISLKEYPEFTLPGSTDGLLTLPHEFILTQSFAVGDRRTIQNEMTKIGNQIANSDDAGSDLELDVRNAQSTLSGSTAYYGYHHLTVMALAPNIARLNAAISDISSEMTRLSLLPVREVLNTEPAFWSQIPGNFTYIARKALISSQNFVGLFSGHNYPSGERRPEKLHWGLPIALLETSSQTAYYFNFHIDDLGNFTILGPSGSGKTVALLFLMALSMRVRPRPRCIYFDKDRAGEIFIRALGGNYEALSPGTPTGFAPLQLDDTPTNRAFAYRFVAYLLKADGVEHTAAELGVISTAVDHIFDKFPKEERVLSLLSEVLPGKLKPGMNDLTSRLKPWVGNGNYAWLFNNDVDRLDFTKAAVGFDMTAILDEPKLRTAALLYIFERISGLMNGDPLLLFLDEGWKLLDDAEFSDFVQDTLKTIRKKNGIVGFGTQQADDIVRSKIPGTLLQQTATNIFFPNPKADALSHKEYFTLTDKEFNWVRETSKETREFLIKHGNDSVIARLDLGFMPDLLRVLSATSKTIEECAALRAKFGDDPADWLPYFCGWENADDPA